MIFAIIHHAIHTRKQSLSDFLYHFGKQISADNVVRFMDAFVDKLELKN